jgi:hypothetical protein
MNFFKASEIESSEYENGQLLNEAFETARTGHRVSRVDRKLLKQRVCRELIAVNNYSRILWGRAICNELSGFFCHDDGDVEHVQDVYSFGFLVRLLGHESLPEKQKGAKAPFLLMLEDV